jgi:adenosylmethionine-8-amino-7-oxononanoate transaminase
VTATVVIGFHGPRCRAVATGGAIGSHCLTMTGSDTHDSWVERDAAVVWHGFTQMAAWGDNTPVIVESGEGREVIDTDGRRYLDAISSLWVTTLGHRVPQLDEALRAQIDRIAHSTMLGNGNRVTVEFAEALAAVVPVDDPHILFAADGAAAVEQALKMALQYWRNLGVQGRTNYLTFGDAYHGDTVGSLSLGGDGFGSDTFDALRFPVLRAPSYADPDACAVAAAMVAEHAGELAAVVVEPYVQGAAGMRIADPGGYAVLARACREHEVLLICDEVATGFGRTGTLFASERCGLRPDILCLGKGITGGYLAMSATVAAGHVHRAFLGEDLGPRTFHHGHSYGGNALAAAVALRHLELFEELDVLANVGARSAQLAERLERLRSHRRVVDVRLAGLLGGVEIDCSDLPRRARLVASAMIRAGVLTRSMGPVVTIVPILTSTAGEIDRIVDALEAALDEVDRAG